MTEFYCRCGHSIDVHMNDCLVGTCECRRSVDEVTDYNVARMSRGLEPLTPELRRGNMTATTNREVGA